LPSIGSLIVWPTPAEPRLMSLVPATHFVLLDEDTIHADFYTAMTAGGLGAGHAQPTPC
jgi:L-lactate dehydrogenase complex protein LldG